MDRGGDHLGRFAAAGQWSKLAAMICANCHETTDAATCHGCGDPPLLQGRYRLDAVVGRGASGTTFRATRLTDGLVVAVKELDYRKLESFKTEELFERESRVLRQLDHPGIPSYVDAFSVEAGRHIALYLVQEFIDGPTLEQEGLRRRYDEDEILDVLEELAEILAYLHSREPPVIHRDIKPRNAMRRERDGQLVLIDFGSVRDVIEDHQQGGSTIAGTVGFMAPEQLAGVATPASDVYGLGALAVRLLSGKEPHQMLDPHHRLDWRAHVDVSAQVARLLERMLELDLEERPKDGRALLAEIAKVRAGEYGYVAEGSQIIPLSEAGASPWSADGEQQPEPTPPGRIAQPVLKKHSGAWWITPLGVALLVGFRALGEDEVDTGRPEPAEVIEVSEPSIPIEPLGQVSYVVRREMTLEQARETVPSFAATGQGGEYAASLVIARLSMDCRLRFEGDGGSVLLDRVRCTGPVHERGMTSPASMRRFLRRKYGEPAQASAEELRWWDARNGMVFRAADEGTELLIGPAAIARP